MNNRLNQRSRILSRLRDGSWIPSVELAQLSLQYCARIAELRQLGYVIVNRTVRQTDGRVFGYFLLEGELPALTRLPDTPTAPEPVKANPKPPQTTAQGELFGDLAPRHRDLA